MARRKFLYDDSHSAKFWEIEVQGDRHFILYGKQGTAGRTVEKQFATEEQAQAAAAKLIREKTGKGYGEVSSASAKPKPSAKRTPPSAPRATPSAALLDEAIYREAAKKGAQVNQRRELPKSVKRCPGFIAEFYQRIVWPKSKIFNAVIGDWELEHISFYGPVQEFKPDSFGVAGCKGMDLFGVGSQQGGNKILLLNGNDKNPSDPTVYEIDHDPEPGDRLWKYCKLSKFLRCLQ